MKQVGDTRHSIRFNIVPPLHCAVALQSRFSNKQTNKKLNLDIPVFHEVCKNVYKKIVHKFSS
jgi:hypothetical protein